MASFLQPLTQTLLRRTSQVVDGDEVDGLFADTAGGSSAIELTQSHFDSGTYRIISPGTYKLSSDVHFCPNPDDDYWPRIDQWNVSLSILWLLHCNLFYKELIHISIQSLQYTLNSTTPQTHST